MIERTQQETFAALRALLPQPDRDGAKPGAAKSARTSHPPAPVSRSAGTPIPASQPQTEAPKTNDVSKGEQKIVDALATLEAVGVAEPPKGQPAGFAALTTALVRKGMLASISGLAALTAAGSSAANKPKRPASTEELQARIGSLLGEQRLLSILIGTHPSSLTRVDLAARAGYSNAKSDGFAAPLAQASRAGLRGGGRQRCRQRR